MTFGKLVFLGDSITEGFGDAQGIGWAGRVAPQVIRNYTERSWGMANLGAGGDTILDGRHRFASNIFTHDATHIIMGYGTNDMSILLWPDESGGTKVGLPYAKLHWMRSFDYARKMGVRLAVVGLLPVIEEKFPFLYIPADENDHGIMFYNRLQKAYNDMLRDICMRVDIPFVDLYDDWSKRNLNELLCDGLHPSTQGYDLMAEQIFSHLHEGSFFSSPPV